MPSPNTPSPDIRRDTLEKTLSAVRQRRVQRRRRVVSTWGLAVVAIGAGWLTVLPLTPLQNHWSDVTKRGARTEPPRPSPAPSFIERVPARATLQWVSVSTPGTSLITRISEPTGPVTAVESVTDDQLLASLPRDRPAGLVRDPHGKTQLVFLRHH